MASPASKKEYFRREFQKLKHEVKSPTELYKHILSNWNLTCEGKMETDHADPDSGKNSQSSSSYTFEEFQMEMEIDRDAAATSSQNNEQVLEEQTDIQQMLEAFSFDGPESRGSATASRKRESESDNAESGAAAEVLPKKPSFSGLSELQYRVEEISTPLFR